MRVFFAVEGTPAPQGSHKAFVVKGRAIVVDDSKATKPWRAKVSAAARTAMQGREIIDAPVEVTVSFYVARPASVSEAKRPFPSVRPDLDKFARSTLDALTKTVFADDSLVVALHLSKEYGEPGATITVTEVPTSRTLSGVTA